MEEISELWSRINCPTNFIIRFKLKLVSWKIILPYQRWIVFEC